MMWKFSWSYERSSLVSNRLLVLNLTKTSQLSYILFQFSKAMEIVYFGYSIISCHLWLLVENSSEWRLWKNFFNPKIIQVNSASASSYNSDLEEVVRKTLHKCFYNDVVLQNIVLIVFRHLLGGLSFSKSACVWIHFHFFCYVRRLFILQCFG